MTRSLSNRKLTRLYTETPHEVQLQDLLTIKQNEELISSTEFEPDYSVDTSKPEFNLISQQINNLNRVLSLVEKQSSEKSNVREGNCNTSHDSAVHKNAQGIEFKRSDGLVLCHISHREFKIHVFASMVKVSALQGKQVGGGKRGAVSEFAKAARKRMIERLSKTRNTDKGAFVTLTYPAWYPDNAATWKRDLDVFLKRLKRIAPSSHGVWRIEPQERGAPHYHLLVFGHPSRLSLFRRWVKLAWFAVVGSGDAKHRAAGTRVDAIHSRRHAIAYASKYAAKPSEGGRKFITLDGEIIEHVGKHWGSFNTRAADCEPFGSFSLSPLEVVELRRMMSRFLKSKGSRYARRVARGSVDLGWSVFGLGDDAQEGNSRRTIMRMLIAATA